MRPTRPASLPLPSEITPPERYWNRREVVAGLAAAGLVGAGVPRTAGRGPAQVPAQCPPEPERGTKFL